MSKFKGKTALQAEIASLVGFLGFAALFAGLVVAISGAMGTAMQLAVLFGVPVLALAFDLCHSPCGGSDE